VDEKRDTHHSDYRRELQKGFDSLLGRDVFVTHPVYHFGKLSLDLQLSARIRCFLIFLGLHFLFEEITYKWM